MLHYEYTNDIAFLKKYEYLIADACRFLLDVQVVDAQGRYIISPTVSPENTYMHPSGQSTPICDGCFFDAQLTHHLFTDYLKVCEILGTKEELTQKVRTRLALLPQPEISAIFTVCSQGHSFGTIRTVL